MFVRVQRFPISSSLFEPVMSFDRGIDEILDSFWPTVSNTAHKYPAIDIAEHENESVVVAELPGVKKEDVKLSLQDGVLTISGKRNAYQLPENSSWLRNEMKTGEFTRTIQLPHDVNAEGVSAELSNGVLRVVLPKSEQVRPREIKVQ